MMEKLMLLTLYSKSLQISNPIGPQEFRFTSMLHGGKKFRHYQSDITVDDGDTNIDYRLMAFSIEVAHTVPGQATLCEPQLNAGTKPVMRTLESRASSNASMATSRSKPYACSWWYKLNAE